MYDLLLDILTSFWTKWNQDSTKNTLEMSTLKCVYFTHEYTNRNWHQLPESELTIFLLYLREKDLSSKLEADVSVFHDVTRNL